MSHYRRYPARPRVPITAGTFLVALPIPHVKNSGGRQPITHMKWQGYAFRHYKHPTRTFVACRAPEQEWRYDPHTYDTNIVWQPSKRDWEIRDMETGLTLIYNVFNTRVGAINYFIRVIEEKESTFTPEYFNEHIRGKVTERAARLLEY